MAANRLRLGATPAGALPVRTFAVLLAAAVTVLPPAGLRAQSDLDSLMKGVLSRRDDNWKKLQQFVLDERESMEARGPGQALLWGQRSDYTWFIREGFFVRSPLKVNGAVVGDVDRRKYEADYLKREQERERRYRRREGDPTPTETTPADAPGNIDGLLKQTRQPGFISSSYFLRFKFDEGHYALVGR